MQSGWKATEEEMNQFAELRGKVADHIEGGGQLTTPDAQFFAVAIGEAIDEHQTKEFYHGMASALKMWANNLMRLPESQKTERMKQLTRLVTAALTRCASLWQDAKN